MIINPRMTYNAYCIFIPFNPFTGNFVLNIDLLTPISKWRRRVNLVCLLLELTLAVPMVLADFRFYSSML